MRKTIALVLALVMIMSLATVYAEAFTPPGQAKKNERLLTKLQDVWSDEELEEVWGLWRLPFGLLKKGLTLPPGLEDRDDDDLPPGIQKRFMNTMQERVRVEDPILEDAVVVDNLSDLMDALDNEDTRLILLAETIVIDEDTEIEGDLTIRYLSEADIEKIVDEDIDVEGMDVDDLAAFDGDWLFEVEDEELTLRNVTLVGDGKKGDIGLVKVEAGAELVTDDVWFSKAHTAVKIVMADDVTDLDEDELDALVEKVEDMVKEIAEESENTFRDIATYVLVVDENDVDILEYWEDEE